MLFLRTFGGLSLENGDRPFAGAAGQRGRLAVLAVLAAAGDTGISRDRLCAMFWPDSDTERARGALKQALYALRRDVREQDLTLGTSELRLNCDLITSDVHEFERAVLANDLEGAVARYAGPFLDGIHLRHAPEFERWAGGERERLMHEFRAVLEQLANAAERRHEPAAAVEWWRKRAATEPVSARVARAYMTALAAAGDREAAGRHARIYADLVRSELDEEPDPSITTLANQLRAGDGANVGVGAFTPTEPPPVSSSESVAASIDASPLESTPRRRPTAPDGVLSPTQLRYAWFGAVALIAVAAWAAFAAFLRPTRPFTIGITTQITTTKGLEVDPAISPDGKLVAYAAGPMGAMRIFVKQILGGRVIPLTTSVGGNQRWPKWSPDGSRIIFQATDGIYVVPSLGGDARRLVEQADMASGASWSPDGKRIAFSNDRGIWIRNIEVGAPIFVATGGFQTHSPAWSPDGSLLAYVVGNPGYVTGNMGPSSIWMVPVAGGTPTRITDLVHLNTVPVFAPDGRSILYVSNHDGALDVFQQPLRGGTRPWGPPSRLTTGSNAISIGLSGDGKQLVYSALILRANIWTVPITPLSTTLASSATQLTSDNQNVEVVTVSRDGKWLIFDSNKNGNQDIYKLSTRGGEPIQLTNDSADEFAGVLSPDDREIAYYSFHTGVRHLHVMSADGTNDRSITDFRSHEWTPNWNPDGSRISFTSIESGQQQLYIVDRAPAGKWSTPRRITNQPDGVGGVVWSPDGRYFACTRDSGLTLIPVNGERARVVVDGRKVGHVPDMPTWGSDPSVVYYRATSPDGEIGFWVVPVSGGTPRLLLRLDDPSRASLHSRFATDGKHIYFTVDSYEADVWIAELKR